MARGITLGMKSRATLLTRPCIMLDDCSGTYCAPGWHLASRRGVALALLAAAGSAHGLGIGGYEVQSSLGETLRVVVQVSVRPDETLDQACFKIHPFNVA